MKRQVIKRYVQGLRLAPLVLLYRANKAELAQQPLGGIQEHRRRRRSAPRDARASRSPRSRTSAARSRPCRRISTLHRTPQIVSWKTGADGMELGENIDWATAEALAFSSLLLDGHRVRLSGQDSERGTFSQRHAVLFDQETEKRYTPFQSSSPRGRRASRCSTRAVGGSRLGFEYGYRSPSPMR